MKYLNRENVMKFRSAAGRYGLRDLYNKTREKMADPCRDYPSKFAEYMPTESELSRQRSVWEDFEKKPLISIVVPVYNANPEYFKQMADSVMLQTYPIWQLCVADGSDDGGLNGLYEEEYAKDERILYVRIGENLGISGNTEAAIKLADGEYIAFLDYDDTLAQSALYEVVRAINETGAGMIYSDEDQMSEDAKEYMNPHFKPDFNRELLIGNNYICHLFIVSRDVMDAAGGMNGKYDGAQDHDLILRCAECTDKIYHIKRILYHWRIHKGSSSGNVAQKLYAYDAGVNAVKSYMERQGWNGKVFPSSDAGYYLTEFNAPHDLKLCIYLWGMPSSKFNDIKNHIDKELDNIKALVRWKSINDSYFQFINVKDGVSCFTGTAAPDICENGYDYVIFLNAALVDISQNAIAALIGRCAREGIYMAGGRTVCDGKVLQCGFDIKGGEAIPRFASLSQSFRGYMKHAYMPMETDAVSPDLSVIKLGGRGVCVTDPSVTVRLK